MPAEKPWLRSLVSIRTECPSLRGCQFAPELSGERPPARGHAYPAVAWRRRLGLDLARGSWGEVAQHLHREWPAERQGGRRDFTAYDTVREHPIDVRRAICPTWRVQPGNLASCPIAEVDQKRRRPNRSLRRAWRPGSVPRFAAWPPATSAADRDRPVSSGTLTGCPASSCRSIHASSVLSGVKWPAPTSKPTGWR